MTVHSANMTRDGFAPNCRIVPLGIIPAGGTQPLSERTGQSCPPLQPNEKRPA